MKKALLKEGEKIKELATVNQYQGLYLFIDSEPQTSSRYLGTVKTKWSCT
jgi:hypothetical protein